MGAEFKEGLENIAVAKSKISYVNGQKGELIYRGQWAGELAISVSWEDVLHLILREKLPDDAQRKSLHDDLAKRRALDPYMLDIIKAIPASVSYMAVMRSVISSIALPGSEWPPTEDQALTIIAKAPPIVATRYRVVNGLDPIQPDPSLGHVENFLYMLTGKKPAKAFARALSAYLILCIDHEMNASTFAARVSTSTEADIVSAICSGISTLIGPLHGGAPSKVDDLLDEIETEDRAEKVLLDKILGGDRLMGFGHRVYKTWDPRAAALKVVAHELASKDKFMKLSVHVEQVAIDLLAKHKPGRNLYPNVEFWAAAVLRGVGLPRELYTPMFCCTRIAGWCAHILEQSKSNRLIRPSSIYEGEWPDHEQNKN